MGHDNIDKQIKKKLEGRLLEPSDNAWDKLDSLLEKEEDKTKSKTPFYWIAASIMLLLGVFFIFQRGDSENDMLVEPVIVEVENNNNVEDYNLEKDYLKSNTLKEVLKEQAIDQTASVVVKQSQNTKKVKRLIKEKKEELPTAYEINELDLKTEGALLVSNMEEEKKFKEDNYNIDFEIDSLLAAATTGLDSESKSAKVETVIDADALLADVEEELDMSFKEKVFKKIKLGFKKTKTTVAKRNN